MTIGRDISVTKKQIVQNMRNSFLFLTKLIFYLRCLKGDRFELKTSASLKVGDIIEVNVNQRIPADLVLLYSSEPNGTVFLRTDQLDGETDWKIRYLFLLKIRKIIKKGNQ